MQSVRSRLISSVALILLTPPALAAWYQRDIDRGRATTTFASPTSSYLEECVIPKPFAGGAYSKKDIDREDALCTYDFYTPGKKDPLAICPKVESTNPALELFTVDKGQTKTAFEATECLKLDRSGKKQAKYKQSITCSYTPSILGYYHLSRILGEAGRVPPAVIRTMDRFEHIKQVNTAIGIVSALYPDPATIIRLSWESSWTKAHNNPKGNRSKPFPSGVKAEWLFDTALTGIYGALVYNPRGEQKYSELAGAYKYDTRYETFKSRQPYLNLIDTRPIQSMVLPTLRDAAPRMQQMKDLTDMILMDFLLNQQDRVGNWHFEAKYYYLENGDLKTKEVEYLDDLKKKVDPTQAAEMKKLGAAIVKELILKDNDCGVVKANKARQYNMLSEITHMDPRTYRRFVWFANEIQKADVQARFKRELLFTDSDLKNSKTGLLQNVADAKQILESGCRAGTLMLDLDLRAYLNGKLPVTRAACDLPTGYDPAKDVR